MVRSARCVLVVGTQRRVGKSVVVGGLARLLRDRGVAVGVFKPVSIGCESGRHGLLSPDVAFLAECAQSPHDLATLNPVRYRARFIPAECARREGRSLELDRLDEWWGRVSDGCAVVLTEGVGGLLEPLDSRTTILDLARRWEADVILVAPSAADSVNGVLTALDCLHQREFEPLAILLNRYEADSAPLADEWNPEQIARFGRSVLPLMIPGDGETSVLAGRVGPDLLAALRPLADLLARA